MIFQKQKVQGVSLMILTWWIGIFMAIANPMQASAATSPRPNVILILTDDQGYGDLACHGNPIIQTPNLDNLYRESARFTDFHVNPTCAPTRASLMTGMYASRVGVWHTVKGYSLMSKDQRTMADIFRANGYKTAIFGKWHLGDNYPYRPQDRGFDEVLIHKGGGIGNIPDYWANDYFDDTYFRNGNPESFKGFCTDVWFREALKFIDANRDNPFFCYLPLNAPHLPYVVPEKYRAMYADTEAGLREFYGMITNIDDNIGILRSKLEAWDLAQNTILVFMTDNGTARGRSVFNAGMRGGKGQVYEGGHRVPFFISWPDGHIALDKDIEGLSSGMDVLPTLVDLCGLDLDDKASFDGVSLVPLLRKEEVEDRIMVVDNQRVEYPQKYNRTVVMEGKWRWVDGMELYNLDKDPGQQTDVANSFPEKIRTLRKFYNSWWEDIYGKASSRGYPISIGSPMENPSVITAHDLHGAVVWSQDQVLAGKYSGGYWDLYVESDGEYEISLRRFPLESGHAIQSTPLIPPDLKYLLYYHSHNMYAVNNARALRIPARGAQLVIGGQYLDKPIPSEADPADRNYTVDSQGQVVAVNFQVHLEKGPTRMSAQFINDESVGEMFGVYYVYITKK